MYVLKNWPKLALAFLILAGYPLASSLYWQEGQIERTERALAAFADDTGRAGKEQMRSHSLENTAYLGGWLVAGGFVFLLFLRDAKKMVKRLSADLWIVVACLGAAALAGGCTRRTFEPIKLEVVKSNEEAFLLPLTGNVKKQGSSDNEAYLKENLVYGKQVQIPQQWVVKGYQTTGWNGEWRDAALLIKVDKSPVTREWTADPTTGTSNKNEAVWVMTSDQVEFSTGWTITARIAGRDDAVKFLHNYPNGALSSVLDTEVRSKLQAEFGLEVTDLPMDELRKNATPHIVKVVTKIMSFFKERGVTITNLGITGGFVYKDKSIIETMVKVFNAEQQRSIAVAATNAQREQNNAVILKAQGEADAIMKTRKAEADGIKMVAEARNYELEKAKQDMPAYLHLKQLELQRELLLKWDGAYPRYFMGGGAGSNPNMLLQLPALDGKK